VRFLLGFLKSATERSNARVPSRWNDRDGRASGCCSWWLAHGAPTAAQKELALAETREAPRELALGPQAATGHEGVDGLHSREAP
jgi:hypothetical protein